MQFGVVLAVVFLAGFTNIRAADIQMVEVALVLCLVLAALQPKTLLRIAGAPIIVNLLPLCLWAFGFLFLNAVFSIRLDFFPPVGNYGPLKLAPWASLIRSVQTVMAISTLFVVGLAVRGNPANFRTLLTAYVWGGYVNVAWGLFSFVAWLGGIKLPGVTTVDVDGVARICGFFIEGGPFGVYIAGVMVVQVIRGYYLRYVSTPNFVVGMGFLGLAFVGAQSKASVLLLIFLLVIYLLKIKRIGLVVLGLMAVVPLVATSNLAAGLNGYYHDYTHFEQSARERPDDYGLLMGRLAAAVLVPRMIAQYPVFGVGIGNYSLMRNDPSILRGLPRIEQWDLSGLGVLGYMAELGIPLTLLFVYLYAYPLFAAWRRRPWIVLLCAYPLLAGLFGVQLYFAYPWVLAGIGLAAIEIDDRKKLTGRGSPRLLPAPSAYPAVRSLR